MTTTSNLYAWVLEAPLLLEATVVYTTKTIPSVNDNLYDSKGALLKDYQIAAVYSSKKPPEIEVYINGDVNASLGDEDIGDYQMAYEREELEDLQNVQIEEGTGSSEPTIPTQPTEPTEPTEPSTVVAKKVLLKSAKGDYIIPYVPETNIDTSQFVKKTGDTMSGTLYINNGNLAIESNSQKFLVVRNKSIELGDSSTTDIPSGGLSIVGKDNKTLALIQTLQNSGKNILQLALRTIDNKTYKSFTFGIDKNNKEYFSHPQIISTYVNGTSGYNIWSNGFCEQWGHVSSIAKQTYSTITLLKKMKDTNYNMSATGTEVTGSGDNGAMNVANPTVSTFQIFNSSDLAAGSYWQVKGYLAASEY